jgi:hypothetical protein
VRVPDITYDGTEVLDLDRALRLSHTCHDKGRAQQRC